MISFFRGMTLSIDEAATSGHKASWLMSYVVAFSDGAFRDDAAIFIARCV